MRLSIGQTVLCRPQTFWNGLKPMCGTVIWVHPKRRFIRVAFEMHTGSLTECFSLSEVSVKRRKGRRYVP